MMKFLRITFLLLVVSILAFGQEKKSNDTPKLVVGIVVDQMRYDYIYRYWDKFGADGFKKLVNNGYFCKNTRFDYVPTYTGPGHASIFTGTTPAIHGIIANDWYSRDVKKKIYCTEDKSVKPVGGGAKAGLMSPKNMLSSTFCDELRLSTNMQAKVVGIALKDRGAILPAGHTANAAYWLDNASGDWISSTFYMEALPEWVVKFNEKKYAKKILEGKWETINPIASYSAKLDDNNKYEGKFANAKTSSFPHDLALAFKRDTFEVIRYTPFGNTLTKDFAIEALKVEALGKDNIPDVLTVSFSSTDYVGHKFGPSSIEVEDTYIRLDKDLAELLKALDTEVGKENYVLFLTADHAAPEVPKYMHDNKMPGGYFSSSKMRDSLKTVLHKKYSDSLVVSVINQQVFLNMDVIRKGNIKQEEVEKDVAHFYTGLKGVANVYTSSDMKNAYTNGVDGLIKKGYNSARSGNVIYNLAPNWIEYYDKTGTSHGSPYAYDTHVPLIWYGKSIKAGSTVEPVNITDIAPTVSLMLNVNLPGTTIGNPIPGVFK